MSRIYLELHYATDVIAGFIAGFIWVDTVIIASRFLYSRRQRRAGQAREHLRDARVSSNSAAFPHDMRMTSSVYPVGRAEEPDLQRSRAILWP